MGKRRIEIKKIENQQALYVTFSKRRAGLFKKASQFSKNSELDVALVVFSPAGNVFEWSNTNTTRAVMDRFLAANQFQSSPSLSTPPLFPVSSEMKRCLNIDISNLSKAELQVYLHDLDAAEAELLSRAQQGNQTPPPSDLSACVLEQGIINYSSSSPDDDDDDDDDDVNVTRVIPNCIDCHGNWIDGLSLHDLMSTDNREVEIPIDLAAVNTADFLFENWSDEAIGLPDLMCTSIEEDDNSWIMTSYSDYSSCGLAKMATEKLDSMIEEFMEGSNNCSPDSVLSEDISALLNSGDDYGFSELLSML